jgi:drug/metabolite transporter (DMT)-like permease
MIGYLYIVSAAMLYGLLVFGGKVMESSGFSLAEVLIYPNAIVVVALISAVWKRRAEFVRVKPSIYLLYFIIAVMAQVGQYVPLFIGVPVSIVVFCLYTQPVWTILFGRAFFGQKITAREGIIAALVIVGLILLVAPWREVTYSFLGVMLAIVGGMCMAMWVLVSHRLSELSVSPTSQTFIQNFFTSVPFILFYPMLRMALPAPAISAISIHSATEWGGVIAYSLSVMIVAPMLFYKASQSVKPLHLGIILLLEPVVGTLLDVSFFGTSFTWNIAIGGVLIIAANTGLILRSSR